MGFHDGYFSRAGAFTLKHDRAASLHSIGIPVSTAHVDYTEHYRISAEQYDIFVRNPRTAKQFADGCRRHEHDDLLVLGPGCNRGEPRMPDESDEVQAAITYLDTFTSFPRGVALGIDVEAGQPYLSIPAGAGHSSEEWRYFLVLTAEREEFEADIESAVSFADACRRGEHDDRLVAPHTTDQRTDPATRVSDANTAE
ncbi:hypothetical protein [Williamsia phyllosphaerae]|uniref:Uncharacterized protein n=1 Tax=Williamsia phyllosphaerae TaxID=885042 RepID=A0ABQ1V2N4_9NOCA|nr:hypothetical protein [Williamsia phyllosphaerae]GGF35316.1 hypothetical protein GCM10007298_33910 [Williamsia phyllosphaerae]